MAPVLAASAAVGFINPQPQKHNQVSYSRVNDEKHFEENCSASIILLTNLATFIESVIFGSLHALSDIQASARILTGLLASLIEPSSTKSLTDADVNNSLDAPTSTFSEPPSPNTAQRESGRKLTLLTSALLSEEDDNIHLDYSISQLDVLRMSRAASKRVRGDNIDRSSATTHHNDNVQSSANLHEKENNECMSKDECQVGNYCDEEQNELICSSHEDADDVSDDVGNETHYSPEVQGLKQALEYGGRPEFSWLIVPKDPVQDALKRVPNSNELASESSSICSSQKPSNEYEDFDICHVHFLESGNQQVNCERGHLSNSVDSQLMMVDLKKDGAQEVCKSYKTNQQLDGASGWTLQYFKRIGTIMSSNNK